MRGAMRGARLRAVLPLLSLAGLSLAGLSLAGCTFGTGTEYWRADITPENLARDEQACREIAREQAFEESFHAGPIYPPLRDTQFVYGGGDEDGGGIYASISRRGPREYELTEYCMLQRGYTLVPIKPKA